MIFHQKNRRHMKHPLLGPSETRLHFQFGEKKGEIHHHTHLEGDEWPLPKPSFNIEAILKQGRRHAHTSQAARKSLHLETS